MPEYSNYIEGLPPLTDAEVEGDEILGGSKDGAPRSIRTSQVGITRANDRAFSEILVFDKNEIFCTPHDLTGDVNYSIGAGNLINQASLIRQRFITDGTNAINFGSGFDFIYGITNGEILEAGNYEIYFLFQNDSVTVSLPGTTQQASGLTQLVAPFVVRYK